MHVSCFQCFFFKISQICIRKTKSFQKFPNFIFEKVTKNRWKIVVKLVEFMVEKQKFPKVSQFYRWKSHKNRWKTVAKLVEFMLAKQKFPTVSQFYFWKGHKNRWKIVVNLVEFMLEKQRFSKVSPILLLEKPQKSLGKLWQPTLNLW